MQILDWFIVIFIGILLANFVIKNAVDAYVYVKKKLKENK